MSNTERKQRITLRLDGVPLELTVPASEEAFYRRAEQYFNERVTQYRQRYRLNPAREEEREKARIFVAFEIALLWQKSLADKDPQPIVAELRHICHELHRHFGDTPTA